MAFEFSFIGDQFVSFIGPIKDLLYTFCYYSQNFYGNHDRDTCVEFNKTYGVVIAAFPLIVRMLQCGR